MALGVQKYRRAVYVLHRREHCCWRSANASNTVGTNANDAANTNTNNAAVRQPTGSRHLPDPR
jgi:hypothetical protein